MNYVIDSSIALKWIIPELDSDKALRLRDDFRSACRQSSTPCLNESASENESSESMRSSTAATCGRSLSRRSVPAGVSAITSRRIFRRWLSRFVKVQLKFRGYFDLYNIPFRHISQFDFTEK